MDPLQSLLLQYTLYTHHFLTAKMNSVSCRSKCLTHIKNVSHYFRELLRTFETTTNER